MTVLQELITSELSEGNSYNQLAHKIGINHVSIGQYHKGVAPSGKNLAKLAKYFRVDFWILSDKAPLSQETSQTDIGPGEKSYIWRRMEEIMKPLSEEKQLVLLAKALRMKEEGLL